MLEPLARLQKPGTRLPVNESPTTPPLADPRQIERCLEEAARAVTPDDFRLLIGDPGLSMMRATMESIGADSMSIWVADLNETHLAVTHTEPDPSLLGWTQALGEGLTSLAYVSEQALCENRVYLNARHCKRTDEEFGQTTCALISTPFYFGGMVQGVVSAVQLKASPEAPDPPGFSARHLNRARRFSTVLERLVNYRLLTQLLGLEL